MAKEKKLPKPNEVPPVPGAEDWREMYPSYFTFDSGEDKKMANWESEQFWYQNSLHFPRPIRPLDEIYCGSDSLWFSVSASRVVVFPDCMGVPYRLMNGYSYNTLVTITDPKVIEERHKIFAERWQYYLEHWEDWELIPDGYSLIISAVDADTGQYGSFGAVDTVIPLTPDMLDDQWVDIDVDLYLPES